MDAWGAVRSCLVALTGITVMVVVIVAGPLWPGAPAHADGGRPGAISSVRVGEGRTVGADARLVVRWRAARGATSYQVFYAGSRSMAGAKSKRTTRTGIAIHGLRADRGYCFRVRAVRRVGSRLLNGRATGVICARTPRPVRTSHAAWMSAQQVVTGTGGATTTLTIHWPRTGGATSYDLLLAPSSDVLGSRYRTARTGIRVGGGSQETFVLRGLKPDTLYCFRVRGRSSTGIGNLGPLHCKVTMPAARALAPTPLAMNVATFNVCGRALSCQRWSWETRRPVVKQHILMSGADVVAIQEGRTRIADIEADLAGSGFVKACDASGAQAVFVRSSVYAVAPNSADGVRFATDLSHGGCWVRLLHSATRTPVVVASVHLYVGSGDVGNRTRAAQTSQVLDLMAAKYGAINQPGTPRFVIAGDFNSHRSHSVDAPLVRLNQAGFADAYDVSATYRLPYLNSANGYDVVPRTSLLWGAHVDRIFVPQGGSATGWRTISRLSNGRYVAPMPSDHHPVAATVYLPPATCTLGLFCS
ncbi:MULTISPECIES: fibronectin type III domain-containing protein [unclassified Nocardioides]|uniref:fibronectin type III domain-containing protein n=1 Tax=unclassified Nocardioides TaxID=2615069 RepID=UPI000ADA28CB|nr:MULTISPECIES: endonuclease/exonuclease/phosphatase family protein [unclassified Nocardioides]